LISRADGALTGLLRSSIADERFVARPGQTLGFTRAADIPTAAGSH